MASILIVDDQQINRKVLGTLLGYAGHTVTEAADGVEALAFARTGHPQLVIVDLLMPDMDGFAFTRELRVDPAICDTRVIFYTATYLELETRRLAKACGVEHVLTKPCEPKVILDTVSRVLDSRPPATPPPVADDFDRERQSLTNRKLLGKTQELERLSERFELILESAGEGICGLDLGGRVSFINSAGARLLGYTAQELVGQVMHLRIHHTRPDGMPYPREACRICAPFKEGGGEAPEDDMFWRKDGSGVAVECTGTPIREEGSLSGAVVVFKDITARIRQHARVARLNRVRAVLSGINATIVRVASRDELVREACRIAVEQGGFALAWIGLTDGNGNLRMAAAHGEALDYARRVALSSTTPPCAASKADSMGRVLAGGQPVVVNDMAQDTDELLNAEANEHGLRGVAKFPLLVLGEVRGVCALYAREAGFFDDEELKLLNELAGDISFSLQHIEQREKLHHLSHYDALTGLPTWDAFLGSAEPLPKRGNTALLIVDLSRLRAINDSLGRHVGDAVLQETARRLRPEARLVCRIGGDQFGMLLEGIADAAAATAIALRVLAAFAPPSTVDGDEITLQARAGIALHPEHGANLGELRSRVEVALTRAKEQGEPCMIYSKDMTAHAGGRLALERDLHRALKKGEFVLHYQPKIELASGRVVGVEALLRWTHPQRGLVSPGEFIPMLEETGMIREVGRWALREAAQRYAAWHGAVGEAPRIAVNLSSVQLRQSGFVDEVREALGGGDHGVDVEITESLVINNLADSVDKLKALRDVGVRVALDDFGTGYSSLSYLSKLPLDFLKIDRSFIIGLSNDPNAMTLTQTVISLGQALGLHIIAEGVETEEQKRLLKLLRCNEVQGYLLCRPVSEQKLLEFLSIRKAA